MLDGWRNQQLARNLALSTINGRERKVRAFAAHADAFPWNWSSPLADEWFGDPRSVHGCGRSTLRGYQEAVRLFCDYTTDPAYEWAAECERRFGTHPIQICHEWNTAVHMQECEAEAPKRAFTRDELQTFFDYADDQVERVRGRGRKGWLPSFRDTMLFKTAYAFGLRRNETRMLDTADFGRNPEGAEFGEFGICYVRHGKAKKGSPPKRRSVLTVWEWSVEILDQWTSEVRPAMRHADAPALWPSERGRRVGLQRLDHAGKRPQSLRVRPYEAWNSLFSNTQGGEVDIRSPSPTTASRHGWWSGSHFLQALRSAPPAVCCRKPGGQAGTRQDSASEVPPRSHPYRLAAHPFQHTWRSYA